MGNSDKNSNQADRPSTAAEWINPGARWTLLFIGNRGKPITLKRFKGMVLLTVVLIVVSISSGVGLFLWNRNILHEKNQLETQLKMIEEQKYEILKTTKLLAFR